MMDSGDAYSEQVTVKLCNACMRQYSRVGYINAFFVLKQIEYLHDIIEPDDMCLSGGGFFCLNKALLVSVSAFYSFIVV
ncbi:hypothetical protein HPB48_014081 [Haemaphysalis longicornis]|uniref:Uncharacterized protein n=1 Tax=Haemaphysalis longicornis TaxID=44386 RepID=A0A9J6GZ71_HAELO|nr:hypothetical protein HPB48_014081 [Haemaphysalis longicornis]